MSWNNGYETKKFEARQKKQAEEYRALGMTEDQIQAMYEFDLEQFKSERRHRMHTQPLQVEEFEENDADESDNTLLNEFFDELTCTIETSGDKSRYWWVEEIDDSETVKKIKSLSERDLEILTLMVIDELTHEEIAKIMGVCVRTIERVNARFKNLFKKI
jgi:DNA-directed RNA polymerase specialized sigma subunit